MAALKSKKTTVSNIKFTAEQKRIIKEEMTLAVEEAYLQGREDGIRAQQKITAAREKAIQSAAAKFDKEQKKAEKGTSPKKAKAKNKTAAKTVKKTEAEKIAKTKAKPAGTKTKTTKVKAKKLMPKAKKNSPIMAGESSSKKRGRPAKLKIETPENNIETPVSVSE